MYPVSDAFLRAVRSNTRKYFWTGTIVTKGGMTYEFGAKEIVKGSGYISRQCCGSTEIELGTVYAAKMGITLLSDIDRYTLEDVQMTLVFHLAKCLELKAYDFMLRFDKSFNGFETVGTAYDFIAFIQCVYLWMENGSGTVDVGDCIASVSGQAMAAGEAWDGKLEVEDYSKRFAIGGGLDVNGFWESLSMQMKETVNRGFEVYFAERAGISGFCRPVEMEGVR